MRTLSLTQPWASLIAHEVKRIETRSFKTSHRGPLAIHASKGFPGDAKRFCESRVFCRAMGWPECPSGGMTQEWCDDSKVRIQSLPLGCVVAIVDLVDCLPTVSVGCLSGVFEDYPDLDTEQERAFGNYDPGRYGWVLENVRKFSAPIPAKGSLGLWEWNGLEDAYQGAMKGVR